jgi:hypothetical protein
MTKETGGPAFPLHNHGVQTLGMHISGMTLRDYFAAKAMPQAFKEVEEAESYNINDVAAIAYQYADAMLKEREQ